MITSNRRIRALEQETRELDVERMQNENSQDQLRRNYPAGQLPGEVVYTTLLSIVCEVFYIREKNCCRFLACTLNRYSPRPNDNYIKVSKSAQDRDVGLGEVDSETLPKGVYEESFSRYAAWIRGEVNPTHAYYNSSCTRKDTKDPSWSTCFKTRRSPKTSSALEEFILLYLCLIGTFISFHINFAMSTQQDIYVAGSKNHPPNLNKDNYVPWSSRLLHYAKSKPNRKLIYNSIMHGPYVRRMIPKPGDPDREDRVAETFHEQTDEELTKKSKANGSR
ncbi:hypothetical protein Tco_1108026 [Tanacetum coccineum]